MEQLFPFLVSNLFLLVFYGIYYFFLKNETFHQANRVYLISSTILAASLPWIDIPSIYSWFIPLKDEKIYTIITMDELQVVAQKPQSLITILLVKKTYLLVSFFFIIRSFVFLTRGFFLKSKISFTNKNAFSFFGKIYIDPTLPHFDTLIEHEETHTRQGHVFDLLFFETIKALFWINPVVFWINRQIRVLHEFLADDEASETMNSKYQYSMMLLSRHFGLETNNPFMQSFFKKSTIKQRISMLAKDPSHNRAQLKYFVAVPAIFILIMASSFTWIKNIPENVRNMTVTMEPVTFDNTKENRVSVSEPKNAEILEADTTKPVANDNEIFTVVEEQPEFPGGSPALYRYLGDNIVYPKAAQRANVSGRVFVKFIIKKDGSIENVTILRGIGFGCDEEAVRVIQSSPKWKPGKQKGKAVDVYYNMPVVYKLDGEKDIPPPSAEIKSGNIPHTPKEKPLEIRFTNNSYENALIIVNGIEILDRKINDLEPSSIESVSVLKGEEAIKAYGEKGKNGVIMIKTKTR
jgi:TonB family protein